MKIRCLPLPLLIAAAALASPEPGPQPKTLVPLNLARVMERGAGGAAFREPSCVRALGDGTFLVTEATGNRITLMTVDGRPVRAVGSFGLKPEQFDHPRTLALRAWKEPLMLLKPGLPPGANEVLIRSNLRPYPGPLAFVCDNSHRLRVLTGDLASLVSGLGFEAGEAKPWSVDLDAGGILILMEPSGLIRRLVLDSLEGPRLRPARELGKFGGPGPFPGGFRDPLMVKVLSDHSILVVDSGHGLLQRFKEDGSFLNSVGQPGYGAGSLIAPCDVAVDEQGRLYITDLLSPLIEVFLPSGPYLKSLDPRPAAGPGSHPTSVSVDKDGTLILADRYRGRILLMREPAP